MNDGLSAGTPCPNQDELVAFVCGNLGAEMAHAISDHLAACPRCLSHLEGLAEGSDLQALRRSLLEPAADEFAADPEYRRMEEWANGLLAPEDGLPPLSGVRPAEMPVPFALGQYQVVAKIGEGGMGAVYRALHPRLKKTVAIKVLPPHLTADARAVARFQREMEAIGRLDHPNIIRATDAGEADGIHFLVMEFIDGMDLSHLVQFRVSLPVPEACELARQAAAGLQAVDEHGLVHRDIKPSNLLLSVKGELKILDLGLALLTPNGPASAELTAESHVMGTADYMAPEQWEASHTVDIRADLYSLGCTLYTLLAGKPPFSAHRSAMKKMRAHGHEPAPPLAECRADLPPDVTAVVERLLAKDPAARYQHPQEVVRALEPFCRGADVARLVGEARAAAGTLLPDPRTPDAGGHRKASPPLARTTSESTSTAPARRRLPALATLTVLGIAAFAVVFVHQKTPPEKDALAPQQPRRLVPKQWNNLMEREPEEFFWWNPVGNYRKSFDPGLQRVFVQTHHTALLSLGRTDAPGYTLELRFRQETWHGGVGVFFGGQRTPDGACHFHFIELRGGTSLAVNSFRLHRGRGEIRVVPDSEPSITDEGVNSWRLPEPPGDDDQVLEIRVSLRGLESVRWNGAMCVTLQDTEPGVNEYRGEFGIYVHKASAQITSGRIRPSE
jgi:serine/threonine protein kinase